MSNGIRSLLQQLLLIASVLTYLKDPEDIVWRFVQHAPRARLLEHLCFGAAAIALGIGAWLCTLATARDPAFAAHPGQSRSRCAGEILWAIAIGSLLPLAGFLLLVCGEAIRVLRQEGRRVPKTDEGFVHLGKKKQRTETAIERDRKSLWRSAVDSHLGMWSAFISMLVFSLTLVDRLAEILFAISALISLLSRLVPFRKHLAAKT